MPTSKPRIAVTLNHRVYETIERMAQLQGVSRAHVVAELLDAVHEPLMRTVALLEAAAEAPEEVKRGLYETVLGLERELVGTLGGALAQTDWLRSEFGRRTAEVGSFRGRGKGLAPVPVTRGSGTEKQGLTKGRKRGRK